MTKLNEQSKSLALINRGIASLSKSKVRDEVARIATLIVIHAVEYDDISSADRLCEVVKGLGMRNDSLGKWFLDTGCARIKTVKDGDKETKRFGIDKDKQAALAERLQKDGLAKVATELRAKKWDDAKPKASTYDGFDFDKRLMSLIKQAERAIKDHGSDPKTKVDRNTLAKAKTLVLFDKPEQAAPNLWGEAQASVN